MREIKCIISPKRKLTESELKLIWRKPDSHRASEAEKRVAGEIIRNWHSEEMKITNILLEGDAGSGKTQLAKALSADFGLPYTKITCFADMDKSDVFGAILPVIQEDQDGQTTNNENDVKYQFYPSEIVRAYQNGWLLEIQEPTVIRDAAVLMALNSALEPDGSINLPTEIIHRHPDFIAVITTNRGYNGCRPLNEALRDRIQHTEKMELPSPEIMMERAEAKTGFDDREVLQLLAETIILFDKTAKANAIKGVAGMRSYLFWADAVKNGADALESMYHKVIYKMTTDDTEIRILEDAFKSSGLDKKISDIQLWNKSTNQNNGSIEICADGNDSFSGSNEHENDPSALNLINVGETTGKNEDEYPESARRFQKMQSSQSGNSGIPSVFELTEDEQKQKDDEKKLFKEFRKELNKQARSAVFGSIHQRIRMIVHRPDWTETECSEYTELYTETAPVVEKLYRSIAPMLEYETSADFSKRHVYGSKFNSDSLAQKDLLLFSKKLPPHNTPSLAVALRVDESASMNAHGRIEAAKKACTAVYLFCKMCGIHLYIYGDTADRTEMEQMSLYAYCDAEKPDEYDCFRLMSIKGRNVNRDGMALRVLSEKLIKLPQTTRLLISISDGQPMACPDYYGDKAVDDMQGTIREYTRKGIVFLAAAIGQDKDEIRKIYGDERFLDISDLNTFPQQMVQLLTRYM